MYVRGKAGVLCITAGASCHSYVYCLPAILGQRIVIVYLCFRSRPYGSRDRRNKRLFPFPQLRPYLQLQRPALVLHALPMTTRTTFTLTNKKSILVDFRPAGIESIHTQSPYIRPRCAACFREHRKSFARPCSRP
jgi:hypothetical protein